MDDTLWHPTENEMNVICVPAWTQGALWSLPVTENKLYGHCSVFGAGGHTVFCFALQILWSGWLCQIRYWFHVWAYVVLFFRSPYNQVTLIAL